MSAASEPLPGLATFTLAVAASGRDARVQARAPDGSAASGLLRLSATTARAARALLAPTAASAADAGAVGEALFRALFDGHVHRLWSATRAAAHERGGALRLLLDLEEATSLAALPWELLRDPDHKRFLALDARTPIARKLAPRATGVAARASERSTPMRALLVAAEPVGVPTLASQQELERIAEALRTLTSARRMQLREVRHATLADLARELAQDDVALFHFVGHGSLAGDGQVLLEQPDGQAAPLDQQRLEVLLAQAPALRLAVLNCCLSAADDARGGSLVRTLARNSVPAVVGMQRRIADASGLRFASEMYAALAQGVALDVAVCQARAALFVLADPQLDWLAPVVYLRSEQAGAVLPELRSPERGGWSSALASRLAQSALDSHDRVGPALALTLFASALLAWLCATALIVQGVAYWSRGGVWGQAEWVLWGSAVAALLPLSRLTLGLGGPLARRAPMSTLTVCCLSVALVAAAWIELATN